MRRLETIIIVLSLGFYVWFVWHFGPSDMLGYIRLAGWGLVITISLEAVSRVLNTIAWRVTISRSPKNLGFGELFVARIGGEAVDYITPSAQLGGQFVMALAVRNKVRMPIGLASVVIAALTEAVGQIMFIALALLLSVHLLPGAAKMFWPIAGGFSLAIALAFGLFWVQTRRPFSYLWKTAANFDFARINKYQVKESAAEADQLLIDFYANHRGRLALSCALFFLAWSLGVIEIYILLHLLGVPATFATALLVDGLGHLIERVTFLVPAKLVSQEGGKALILALLGYPPDIGFVVGLLRRAKEMVWVLAGLGGLAIHRAVSERPSASATGSDSEMLEAPRAQGGQSIS
jgi:uncharacterized membrane protein YbhN (UPF0104 family)